MELKSGVKTMGYLNIQKGTFSENENRERDGARESEGKRSHVKRERILLGVTFIGQIQTVERAGLG